jgi:endonuclease/exonuclease/phosphatase family metal-dependent hydrolase
VLELDLPPRSADAGAAPAVELPPAGPGELRVVTWNVLVASPRKRPEPFARVLRALTPDVVLLQEWEGATDAELASWFDAHLPEAAPWHALTTAGWGVAVVARGALEALGPRAVSRPDAAPADPRRSDGALRLAAAVVSTPAGALCAASVHLKCCGSADSVLDLARRAEAAASNETLSAALAQAPPCMRVVGGDLNLVGSRRPLELLAAGLDADRAPLAIVESPVLGDDALYTWTDAASRFSPGRLDYLLYGTTTAHAVRSFAFDTRRLTLDVLDAHGLQRDDSASSDHLPLVLDVVPARPPSHAP